MIDTDDMPRDPDLDDVPSDLRLLHGLGGGMVNVTHPDGTVTRDALVIVPGLFGHARRLVDAA